MAIVPVQPHPPGYYGGTAYLPNGGYPLRLPLAPGVGFGPAFPGAGSLTQGGMKPIFGEGSSGQEKLESFTRLATQERLRFMRERLRQGRAASILSLSGGDPGQGFQLGRKSVLGE